MKSWGVALLGAVLFFSFAGCGPTKGDRIDRNKEVVVSFTELKNASIPRKIETWLENNKEFEQALLVDDDGAFYVVITRGRKNTGGYGVKIEKMTMHLINGKNNLQVKVKYQDPAPGSILTQALTYPYAVAKVNLKEKPGKVEFDIEKK